MVRGYRMTIVKPIEIMDYITCHYRKSWPTVSTVVCNQCKRMGSCPDYQKYLNPSLFPDLPEPEIIRKKPRFKKDQYDGDVFAGPEQLKFEFEETQD